MGEVRCDIDGETVERDALLNTRPERSYFAFTYPDSNQALPPLRLDAKIGQRADDCLLKQVHIVRHRQMVLGEGENWVTH
ncbi:MAG: hypothetical protein BWY10_00128 [Chloroflexi bacterium ADurb.Bin180]|nr:MAG: hypothetical protein BWY10_00128 [Chloroflexi bacterium ADurb.Bin180]